MSALELLPERSLSSLAADTRIRRATGPQQVDIQFVLWLVQILRAFYPKRLGQIALVEPPPFIFNTAWGLVKPHLGKHAQLVRQISARELCQSYFAPGNAPPDLR